VAPQLSSPANLESTENDAELMELMDRAKDPRAINAELASDAIVTMAFEIRPDDFGCNGSIDSPERGEVEGVLEHSKNVRNPRKTRVPSLLWQCGLNNKIKIQIKDSEWHEHSY
jgi:hypothetical protein